MVYEQQVCGLYDKNLVLVSLSFFTLHSSFYIFFSSKVWEVQDYSLSLQRKYKKIMCTVTLSYDANNALAQQKLQVLLSTGLFTQISTDNELDIDYSDTQLYEENSLPIPPDRNLSLDELEQLVVTDIRKICEVKDVI